MWIECLPPGTSPSRLAAALGIVHEGKLVYQKGYGQANLEQNIPINPSTVFYIASTSKQFTAASIALLAKQNKLSLDDDIRKYLPELPEYDSRITLRHLIHHTSGIPDYLELLGLAGERLDDVHSEEEILELLSRQKSLSFKPGDQFLYSNSGYFLLGVIVKRVSGKSLAQFAEEQIFNPLGMTHTRFHDSRTRLVKNRAQGYFSSKEGEFRNYLTQFDRVGDGGLMTTVEDLFRWDQAIENGTLGGKDFASSLLTQGQLNNGNSLTYAFGLMIGQHRGLKTISHGGSFIGFKSELLRFPERRLSVICLCNHNAADATKLAKEVAQYRSRSCPRSVNSSRRHLGHRTGGAHSFEGDRPERWGNGFSRTHNGKPVALLHGRRENCRNRGRAKLPTQAHRPRPLSISGCTHRFGAGVPAAQPGPASGTPARSRRTVPNRVGNH